MGSKGASKVNPERQRIERPLAYLQPVQLSASGHFDQRPLLADLSRSVAYHQD